ncbi:hypothetical protein HanIR_Chr14g0709481 [Helianthus annuus]|nr:hypothetical protein HanIR_Chr14g0709481 [Helianthus annuus]
MFVVHIMFQPRHFYMGMSRNQSFFFKVHHITFLNKKNMSFYLKNNKKNTQLILLQINPKSKTNKAITFGLKT